MTNVDRIKSKARGVIIDEIDRRTTRLGNTVSEHVSNLRNVSDNLRSQGQTTTADVVEGAASRLDAISNYLCNTDGDRVIHDVETIARKQPIATAALGFAGGLVAARLLKASASRRYRTYSANDVPLSEDDDVELIP